MEGEKTNTAPYPQYEIVQTQQTNTLCITPTGHTKNHYWKTGNCSAKQLPTNITRRTKVQHHPHRHTKYPNQDKIQHKLHFHAKLKTQCNIYKPNNTDCRCPIALSAKCCTPHQEHTMTPTTCPQFPKMLLLKKTHSPLTKIHKPSFLNPCKHVTAPNFCTTLTDTHTHTQKHHTLFTQNMNQTESLAATIALLQAIKTPNKVKATVPSLNTTQPNQYSQLTQPFQKPDFYTP